MCSGTGGVDLKCGKLLSVYLHPKTVLKTNFAMDSFVYQKSSVLKLTCQILCHLKKKLS